MLYRVIIFLVSFVACQMGAEGMQSHPETFGFIDKHGQFRTRFIDEQGKAGYKVVEISAEVADFLEYQDKECLKCGASVVAFLQAGNIVGIKCVQGSAKELEEQALVMIASGDFQHTDAARISSKKRASGRLFGMHLPAKCKVDAAQRIELEAYENQLKEVEPESPVLRALGVKLRKKNSPSRTVPDWIAQHAK